MMKRLLLVLVVLFLGMATAHANLIDCVGGTVASYLASGPCMFGSASVKVNGFSSTYSGIDADTTKVQFITRGFQTTLDIRPVSENGFSQYDSGTGSATVEIVFDFPPLGGSGYQMQFYAQDGCCVLGGSGFSGFNGGPVTETITIQTLALIPLGGLYYDAMEQVDSSYSSVSINGSGHYLGESSGPFQLLEFSQPGLAEQPPSSDTPEPKTLSLMSLGAAGLIYKKIFSKKS